MMSGAGLGGNATPLGPKVFVAPAGDSMPAQSNWSTGQIPAQCRWRDLFPLPPCETSPGAYGSSASSKRRRCRVQRLEKESNEVIGVLNEIYAAPLDRSFSSVPTLSQRESQHQIFKQLSRLNRYDLSCKEREAVLEELLHSSPVYGGMEHSTVRVFDRALVSIPKSSSEPIPLAGLLDQIGRDTIEDASNRMLVTEDEWGQIIEQNQTVTPYMDETLRASPQEYVDFIKDMYDAGMLGFTSKPQGLVTPFCCKERWPTATHFGLQRCKPPFSAASGYVACCRLLMGTTALAIQVKIVCSPK